MYVTKSVKVTSRLEGINRDGWHYGGLPGLRWEADNARAGDRAVMEEIVKEISGDPRFEDFFHACINCGNCTAVCPTFKLADFAPRIVVQKVMHAKNEPELLYQMMDQYIWACFQCYSCWEVCPAQNNPGGLVAMLKESAVKHGLASAKKALEPYSKILYKIMTTGTQIAPNMHSSIAPFRDWGAGKAGLADRLPDERAALMVETMAGVTDRGWRVDTSTVKELLVIERESGMVDRVKAALKDVGELVEETAREMGV